MKKLFLLLTVVFAGSIAVLSGAPIDYSSPENWVICDQDKAGTFDVFYIYPTLYADKKTPLMPWQGAPDIQAKTRKFACAQTQIFGAEARVFAPYVRQLEYNRCIEALQPGSLWRKSEELAPGIADTTDSFLYYLQNYNGGRPYILVGHSQGAIDLYRMMTSTSEVDLKSGFVAAYLPGLPHLSAADIISDFAGRDIKPASGADDLGVIIVWNTQAPGAANPFFIGEDTFCINPLNWATDSTPADKSKNIEAFFYDYRDGSSRTIPNFCGAKISENGALLVDLPVNSEFDANGFMGKGVFHMNDIWFFARNIRANAALRVSKYLDLSTRK